MADKTFNARVQLKSDIISNWEKATNFVPKLGEMCVYLDKFETINENGTSLYVPGIKIGNGTNLLSELEFIDNDYISEREISLLFANEIEFYISTKKYFCKEGMTWKDFIFSEYNDGNVKTGHTSGEIVLYHASPIREVYDINSLIIANKEYTTGTAEPAAV